MEREMCRDYNTKNLKICSSCGIEKPLDEFHKKKGAKYGRYCHCKKCKKEDDRRYIENNRDKWNAYNKHYRENNRELVARISRRYYKNNREKHMVLTRNRRARMQGAEGSFTRKEWQALKEKYGNRCAICGKQEPFNQYKKYLTIDHIHPLSKGGTNYIENIQPLCFVCNSIKKDKVQGIVRTCGKPQEASRNI